MQFTPEIERMIAAAVAKGGVTQEDNAAITRAALIAGIDPNDVANEVNSRLVAAQQAAAARQAAAIARAEAERKAAEAAAAARREAERPKKHGEIRKCPNCGAVVTGGAVRCTECGYEFAGVKAASSVKELAEKMASPNFPNKEQILLNFPIPSTREDLLEFIMVSSGRKGDAALGDIYLSKLNEALEKAKVLFPNDPQFAPLIKEHKGHWSNKRKRIITIAAVIVTLILIVVIKVVIDQHNPAKNPQACVTAVTEAIEKGDIEKAEKIYSEFCAGKNYYECAEANEAYRAIQKAKTTSDSTIRDYINSGDLDAAKEALLNNIGRVKQGEIDPLLLSTVKALIREDRYDDAEELAAAYKGALVIGYDWKKTATYMYMKQQYESVGRDFSLLERD